MGPMNTLSVISNLTNLPEQKFHYQNRAYLPGMFTIMDLLNLFRRIPNELRMCTAANFLLVSLLCSVLIQSVSPYPVPQPSKRTRCLSRCFLMSAHLNNNDIISCQEECGQDNLGDGDEGGGVGEEVGVGAGGRGIVSNRREDRLKKLIDILDEIEPTPPRCEHEGWNLKYEKRTEYKKFTVPSAPKVQKRRWGNTIGPCISAHCSGLDGASRLDCIVNMCNRSRRGTR